MLEVKYERYRDDSRRVNEIRYFADLNELADWIFGQMQQEYDKAMSFPTPEEASRLGENGPRRISFRPVWAGEQIWIHQIKDCRGIIFSDGRFTDGQKHWSKDVQEWLICCEERQHRPKFNFVD